LRRFIRPVRNILAVVAIPFAVWLGLFVLKSVAGMLILATLAAALSMVFVTSARARNLFLGLFSVILCIGVSELTLRMTTFAEDPAAIWARGREQNYSAQIFQQDWDLGYTSLPNTSAKVTVKRDGKPVYDVVYSFDAVGGRVGAWAPTKDHAMVIAGDSFNFGEGVGNDDTLSSYIQSKSGAHLSVPNLALPGYGMHQVLRQLELDAPTRHGAPSFNWLVVSLVDNHIERVNGRYSWSAGGPEYAIDETGKLRLIGKFGEHPQPEWMRMLHNGSRFYDVIELLVEKIGNSKDERRFVAIMRAVREVTERKYKARVLVLYHPGSAFINDFVGRKTLMHRLLGDSGVTYIDVNDAIPGIDGSYFIAGDGHPAAKLNNALADLVLKVTTQ
jgi:hypothetical protein